MMVRIAIIGANVRLKADYNRAVRHGWKAGLEQDPPYYGADTLVRTKSERTPSGNVTGLISASTNHQ